MWGSIPSASQDSVRRKSFPKLLINCTDDEITILIILILRNEYNSDIVTKENDALHSAFTVYFTFLKPLSNKFYVCIFIVFQQKAARRQSDGDKFYSLPKKPGIVLNSIDLII